MGLIQSPGLLLQRDRKTKRVCSCPHQYRNDWWGHHFRNISSNCPLLSICLSACAFHWWLMDGRSSPYCVRSGTKQSTSKEAGLGLVYASHLRLQKATKRSQDQAPESAASSCSGSATVCPAATAVLALAALRGGGKQERVRRRWHRQHWGGKTGHCQSSREQR